MAEFDAKREAMLLVRRIATWCEWTKREDGLARDAAAALTKAEAEGFRRGVEAAANLCMAEGNRIADQPYGSGEASHACRKLDRAIRKLGGEKGE